MKLFFDTNIDTYVTEAELQEDFEKLSDSEKAEYNNSFADYMQCSMIEENGSLQEISSREEELIDKFNQYSINEYTVDDILVIASRLKELYEFWQDNE